MDPTISCVIPLYNHERFISEAICSVLDQRVRPDEIIVVDDGSTDRSVDAVRRVQRRSNIPIRLYTQINQGAHAAINHGIGYASGRIIQVLNSDDILSPDRLELVRGILTSSSDPGLVLSEVEFIRDGSLTQPEDWYVQALGEYVKFRDLASGLIAGNFAVSTSNFSFTQRTYRTVGPFRGFRYCHDLDWLLRFSLTNAGWILIRKPTLGYRRHGANTISESALAVYAEEARVVAEYRLRLRALGRHESARLRSKLVDRGFAE